MTSEAGTTGRPATFSKHDAIQRAMNLFWSDGYLAVTARDLARAMQIQRSSFYNTFGSKEAVFKDALQQYVHSAPDARLDELQPGQAVIAAIVSMLRELVRVRASDKQGRGCLVCNSVAELVGVDDELGPMLDATVKRRIEVMKRLFRTAAASNEFEPQAPINDLARSFVAFLLGINVASKTIRSEKELWGVCRTYLLGIGVDESLLQEPA